jgi:IclR family transcriptional regulator, acetate operon repressor
MERQYQGEQMAVERSSGRTPVQPVQPAQTAPSAQSVQSVDRAFRLLERLADTGGAASISDLAADTGLPLPTIHRLVRSLIASGYVRQLPSRRYALGPGLIRLGASAGRLLGDWAVPHLKVLVDQIGESANMAVLEGDAVVYVAQVPSPHSMRMFTEVGRRVLPHCTGVGKALLSALPDEQVRAILARTGMPAQTDRTITSPDRLVAELGMIRRRGYAIDDGEQEPGVRCVAAAVPSQLAGTAALSVSGPSSRVTKDRVERIAPLVIAATEDLVATLGRHGAS